MIAVLCEVLGDMIEHMGEYNSKSLDDIIERMGNMVEGMADMGEKMGNYS